MKMVLSDLIAGMIEEMLDAGGGQTEVRRNDLASRIGCVPSQINYVITSRFTPEKGYTIESRRGGGGYIRIVRVPMTKYEYLMHVFHSVGEMLSENECRAFLSNLLEHGLLTEREAGLCAQMMSTAATEHCPVERRDYMRADMMRRVLMLLMM